MRFGKRSHLARSSTRARSAQRRRNNETPDETERRQAANAERMEVSRQQEEPEVRRGRQNADAAQTRSNRRFRSARRIRDAAINYDPIDFTNVTSIGRMDKICEHCGSRNFAEENKNICCNNGKVHLTPIPDPPDLIKSLLDGSHPDSGHFLTNIRKYNNCFAMTSFSAKAANTGGWVPTLIIHGQVYHNIGSLLPDDGDPHKFIQIYFMDTAEEEVDARMNIDRSNEVKRYLIQLIQQELHDNNELIRRFKTAHDVIRSEGEPHEELSIVINDENRPPGEHRRRYNAQMANEVAVIMPNDTLGNKRDIILKLRGGGLQRINELNQQYDPLQYPLLFPHGDSGYNIGLRDTAGDKLSSMRYYAYRLMDRGPNSFIVNAGKLSQQYIVDEYCKMETERLNYFRANQKTIRAENYSNFTEQMRDNDNDADAIGQQVILPATFTGGPRYMAEKHADSMGRVRKFGKPALFLTMTTNPSWQEITDHLRPDQQPPDRTDVVARSFALKYKLLLKMVVTEECFGEVVAYELSVEFQKRGLGHIHMCIWLKNPIRPEQVDEFVSAEIPDPSVDPELYLLVLKNMIHGPCGEYNPGQKCCNRTGKCDKHFPKEFVHDTIQGLNSFPKYRRRSPSEGGFTGIIHLRPSRAEFTVDNQWVVPYNPWLLRQFRCHINLEICSSIKAIKYILKYINKGCDQAIFSLENTSNQNRDEIQQYLDGRYVGANEAFMRLMHEPVHRCHPPVIKLSVHLENGQRVYFNEDNASSILESPPETTLTAFLKLCEHDRFARTLKYQDVAEYFTFGNKKWQKRKRGAPVPGFPGYKKDNVVPRMYSIHPRVGECYYLRLLLCEVAGPTTFNSFKQYQGITYSTYREACIARGLLQEDRHLRTALQTAVEENSPMQIQRLFSTILCHCEPSNPVELWDEFHEEMITDRVSQEIVNLGVDQSQIDEIKQDLLRSVENQVLLNGGNKLATYGLPEVVRSIRWSGIEAELQEQHNGPSQRRLAEENYSRMTDEQKEVYNEFMDLVNHFCLGLPVSHTMLFLNAPGGTGKTFVLNSLLAALRGDGRTVLATSSR